jgi:hypothetical protein
VPGNASRDIWLFKIFDIFFRELDVDRLNHLLNSFDRIKTNNRRSNS